MVRRRARVAAVLAAVPVPGVDLAGDVAMLLEVIPAINRRFGLDPEQLDQLDGAARAAFYKVAKKIGARFVGQVVTADLIVKVLGSAGVAVATESTLKYIPIAGSIASAVIAYHVFRHIAYRHIESCERVLKEMRSSITEAGD